MRYHLTAIGGSVMHNLAIALHKGGHHVTGSDDQIFEPSKGRLEKYGLLPQNQGWDSESIHSGIDTLILGMHAKSDNPELLRAQELGIPVQSFPEFIYERSKNKTRIAICGSHGKTTITSMILHILLENNIEFDYMVGAQIEGFETMVKLSDAPIIILEGDEYLSSPIHPEPKFLYYKPQICLISGIAWDHINVFPTFENYLEQFRKLVNVLEDGSTMIYFDEDSHLTEIVDEASDLVSRVHYHTPLYSVDQQKVILNFGKKSYTLQIFGRHNMQNLAGAMEVCQMLSISKDTFCEQITSFGGAALRLEKIFNSGSTTIFRDFAHAPSKVKASVSAVKELYPERTNIACLELHTFSSLNPGFLNEYAGSMYGADVPIVYYNKNTLIKKRMAPLNPELVAKLFDTNKLIVIDNSEDLLKKLNGLNLNNSAVLMMSSGNFDNIDLVKLFSVNSV